jgi:hypothetical protein
MAAASLQNLMNQIIQVLVEQGSGIRQLGWLPSHNFFSVSLPDFNGQRWLEYMYFRGRTIDGHGGEKSVAVPLAGFRKELGDLSIFNYFQRVYVPSH